tara:strand:+ start:22276 stop:23871 length:1596 start_codon:yes stop_codon:yes gene_type:complete
MATSISKSVNYKQAAAAPDYQVAARPVDTFVQGERNTKGMQVAAALEQASGAVARFGQVQARLSKEQEAAVAKAEAAEYRKEVVRDKARADGITANWQEQLKSDLANADLTSTTQEEWYAGWKEDRPTFRENVATLTTEEGRLKFGVDLGDVLGTNFDINQIKQQEFKDDEVLTNGALATSQKIPTATADSEGFREFVKTLEEDMSTLGNETNQSRIPKLRAIARQMLTKNDDDRLYEWLLGEVAGRTAIGGGDFQNDVAAERDAIKKKKLADKYKEEDRVEKQRKAKYAIDVNAMNLELGEILRFNPNAEIDTIVQKYIDMDIGDARAKANTMVNAYAQEYGRDRVLPAGTENQIRAEFYALKTPRERHEYIDQRVLLLPTELAQNLRTNVTKIESHYDDKVFKSNIKNLEDIVGEALDADYYPAVVQQFSLLYADYYASDSYKDAGYSERITRAGELKQQALLIVNERLGVDAEPLNDITELAGIPITPLKDSNQAGLDAWAKESEKNGGYPSKEFLLNWDRNGLRRPN